MIIVIHSSWMDEWVSVFSLVSLLISTPVRYLHLDVHAEASRKIYQKLTVHLLEIFSSSRAFWFLITLLLFSKSLKLKNPKYLWCFSLLTLHCQLIANFLLIVFWIKQLSHLHKHSKNLLMVLPLFNLFSSKKSHECVTAKLIVPKPSPDHVTPLLKSHYWLSTAEENHCAFSMSTALQVLCVLLF